MSKNLMAKHLLNRFLLCLLCMLAVAPISRAQILGENLSPHEASWIGEFLDKNNRLKTRLIRVTCTANKLIRETVEFDSRTGEILFAKSEKLGERQPDDLCDPSEQLFDPKDDISEYLFSGFVDRAPVGVDQTRPLLKPAARAGQAGSSSQSIYMSIHSAKNNLQVLDVNTFETVARIEVEPRLFGGLAFSPDGDRLYATLWRSTTAAPPLPAQILILDTSTNQVLDRITLTGDMLPSKPAVSLDGKFLYLADGTLVIVDLAGKTIAQTIPGSAAGGAINQLHSLALSPDGGLICVTDTFGIALLETRTHTFVGRVNISLPNREMAPVFHPNGSMVYIIERRSVSGQLAVWLVAIDTASLTEAGRVTLPGQFDPRNLVITPDGLRLAMDGFLRPAGQPAKAVFMLVDTTANAIVSTNEPEEPTVGALGVILR